MTDFSQNSQIELRKILTNVDGQLVMKDNQGLVVAINTLSNFFDVTSDNTALAIAIIKDQNVARIFREILKYVERGPLEQSKWSALGQKLNEILVGAPQVSESPVPARRKPVTAAE